MLDTKEVKKNKKPKNKVASTWRHSIICKFNQFREYYMKDHYCRLCYISINKKHKTKRNKSQKHCRREKRIIYRHCVEKPEVFRVEGILRKSINDFENDSILGNISCRFVLLLDNLTVKTNKIVSCYNEFGIINILKLLISKNFYHIARGHKFSHMSNMSITFETHQSNMTRKCAIEQKLQLIERLLMKNGNHPSFNWW